MADAETSETTETAERHASWAELFFDLVAVAGVGVLAHVLHDEVGATRLGLYAVLFLAFWLTWTTFMLYGNTAGGRTRVVRLLVGMFGLAVMAASVPGIVETVADEGLDGAHGPAINTFAIAYVATRFFGAGSWRRGQMLLDWPVAQQTLGAIPWVASIWVDEPWKFLLWAVGIAIDIVVIVAFNPSSTLERISRLEDQLRDEGRDVAAYNLGGISLDPAHLGERLGLFVIIVLGEGVIQGVTAASETTWEAPLLRVGLAAFVLLAGMWGLSVLYGYAGVPHLREGVIPLRGALALHAGTTASIAAAAAALGGLVGHATEPVEEHTRWLLCGAITLYFLLGIVAAWLSRGFEAQRIALWTLTGVVSPLLLAWLADDIGPALLSGLLAAVCLSHLGYEWQQQRVRPTTAQ